MEKSARITSATFINSKVTATISIALVLFLLGLLVMLALFANKLSIYIKENLSFTIILNDKMSNAEIKQLQKSLDLATYVKSATYISKEQAAKELEEELGENPDDFLGFNPLSASIEIRLKSEYANSDSIQMIEKDLKTKTNIQDVLYKKELMQSVNENMNRAGLILAILSSVLLLISFALINNTIRLMIYSKRFLIYTMKLVGATDGFIRKPFLQANLISGIVAAFIAITMLLGLLFYLSEGISNFSGLMSIDTLIIVFIIVLALGIGISLIATYWSVNKYLRMNIGEMYKI